MRKSPSTVVTSALPYANGPIHIGHLVEYIQTDIYVRFLKLSGKDCVYCCAGDTHGAPIEINAQKQGIAPEQLIARYLEEHQEDFTRYLINFDSYYSTNSEENRLLAEKIYAKLKKNDQIFEKELELTYCEHCKRFLPDRYVKGTCPKCGAKDQYGDVCEKCSAAYTTIELVDPYCTLCKNKPVRKKSMHLFFRLSDSSAYLKEWLTKNELLQPEIRKQILNWIEQGLDDWCISRDGPYFGFKIPGSDKYFYVWLDAPIGYISSLAHYLDGGKAEAHNDAKTRIERAEAAWNNAEIIHVIGKDIIYFHLLFWPAVLHAAGWKTPDNIVVHGHLTVNGEKMSKSRGTFLTAKEFAEAVPQTEFLRFYYAANLSHSMTDIDLSFRDFTERVNKELVSNVANFVYRTLSFAKNNYDGKLGAEAADARAKELEEKVATISQRILAAYAGFEFRKAVQDLLLLSQLGNQYFQECAPWKDPAASLSVITTCANLICDLSILFAPILPGFCEQIQQQLNVKDLTFKDLGKPLENHQLGVPAILWKKIEEPKFSLDAASAAPKAAKTTKTAEKTTELRRGEQAAKGTANAVASDAKASIDAVAPSPALLDIIIAKIVKVERHPQAEKLYTETLDDGSGTERVIVSGLVPHYAAEELLGKHILLVNNLKPAKLRGVVSQGMLLAAQDKAADGSERVEVLEAPHAAPGTRAKIGTFNHNEKQIVIDEFIKMKFTVEGHAVRCEGYPITIDGKPVTTKRVANGKIR